jgi:hypothetical protein
MEGIFMNRKIKLKLLVIIFLFMLLTPLICSSFFIKKCYSEQIDKEILHNADLPYQYHGQLTGSNAQYNTSQVDVCGTDLGIIFEHNSEHYFVFGDTFGCESEYSNWRSNVMGHTMDSDASDGINLNNWIIDPTNARAKELISSLKIDNVEKTCIPTTAISHDGNIYVYYMSVNHWGPAGIWYCNNASIAISTNNGQTFNKISSISWPGNSNFIQFGIVRPNGVLSSDNHFYLLATPSGRFGACYLTRVPKTDLLIQESYEYLIGMNGNEPIWGSDHTNAIPIISAPVGELSAMWNKYLEKWIVLYTDNIKLSIDIRIADEIWGPWSEPKTITDHNDFPSLYGSYIHPDYVENNGEIVYFVMSVFSLYNTFIMSVNVSSVPDVITTPSSSVTSSISLIIPLSLSVSFLLLVSNIKSERKRRKHYYLFRQM